TVPSPRKELFKKLYEALRPWDPDQVAEQLNVLNPESVMVEEGRVLPEFFKKGGIYSRLLERHPEFASEDPNIVHDAERKAIEKLIDELKKRLAEAKDRLNGDQV